MTPDEEAVVTVEITDSLDLHAFAPRDVADLVAHYLDLCVERGLTEVRIIHGKGVGVQRRIVHGILDHHPAVAGYALAEGTSGGWGATRVTLKPR